MPIYSGFSHEKWWLSIVMLVYKRVVYECGIHPMHPNARKTILSKSPFLSVGFQPSLNSSWWHWVAKKWLAMIQGTKKLPVVTCCADGGVGVHNLETLPSEHREVRNLRPNRSWKRRFSSSERFGPRHEIQNIRIYQNFPGKSRETSWNKAFLPLVLLDLLAKRDGTAAPLGALACGWPGSMAGRSTSRMWLWWWCRGGGGWSAGLYPLVN